MVKRLVILAKSGARPQRLLWASTGTEDPVAPDTLYVEALTARPTWQALVAHHAEIGHSQLHELFAADPVRGTTLTCEAAGWFLDYSKNRVTPRTLELLNALANDCGLRERTAAMFRGESINTTEQRAALHVALRAPADDSSTNALIERYRRQQVDCAIYSPPSVD